MQCPLPSNQNQWKFDFWQKHQILLLLKRFIPKNIQEYIQIIKTITKHKEIAIWYDT